jgi:hypothetical protein
MYAHFISHVIGRFRGFSICTVGTPPKPLASGLGLRSNRRSRNRVRPRSRTGSTRRATGSASGCSPLAEEALLLRVAPGWASGTISSLPLSKTSGSVAPPPILATTVGDIRQPATADVLILSCAGELLGEGRAVAQLWAFPVYDVDCDDEDKADAGEDRAGVLQIISRLPANVGEEGRRGDSEYTGQEVASPAVAARGRGGVRAVGADHVVDGGHVDGVVCDSDDGGEDHAAHPVDRRALDRPGEAEEADWQARGGVEEEPQAGLVLRALVLGFVAALLFVAPDGRDEQRPCDHVTYTDGQESEADFEGLEVPLLVDEHEGLNEHEDQGVGETGQQGQDEHDGLGEEHLEGTDPGHEDLFGGEAVFEGDEFVGTPDVGFLAAVLDGFGAALLGDAVQHDCCAGFGDGEEVDGLDEAAEDQLDPDAPSSGRVSKD